MSGSIVLRATPSLFRRPAGHDSRVKAISRVNMPDRIHRREMGSLSRWKRGVVHAANTTLGEVDKDGEVKRSPSAFREMIAEGGRFPPEAGRYHLYISYACPWAHRTAICLKLKRTRPDLDEHTGWAFADPSDPPLSSSTGYGSFPPDGCVPDNVNGSRFVRDLYEASNDTHGKYSVPVLWDKKEGVIVNNESSEIIQMFNSAMNSCAKNPELDLYPADLRAEIDDINSWVYDCINNGVYRCGFAKAQKPYERAYKELFEALDRCENILSGQRYLMGERLTLADIRLYVTLIRFDPVYVVYFKTNGRFIREYPNLSNYLKELYQMPILKATTNISHIKTHYFTSHPMLNPYAVIPCGTEPWWEGDHDRSRLPADEQQQALLYKMA